MNSTTEKGTNTEDFARCNVAVQCGLTPSVRWERLSLKWEGKIARKNEWQVQKGWYKNGKGTQVRPSTKEKETQTTRYLKRTRRSKNKRKTEGYDPAPNMREELSSRYIPTKKKRLNKGFNELLKEPQVADLNEEVTDWIDRLLEERSKDM